MANYIPPPGTGGKKAAKRKKDPNAPKRPQTAFFVFSAKVRMTHNLLKLLII